MCTYTAAVDVVRVCLVGYGAWYCDDPGDWRWGEEYPEELVFW
jgi:hypothetical protein